MKKIILISLVAFGMKGLAQQTPPPPAPPSPPDPPRKEKVESMRIGFLTQKLDLTPEEAQKFWPVYNEFHKKREELHKKHREEIKDSKDNFDSLSDKQIEAIVDNEMVFRQKNLDLEKEYHSKFKAVLPIKKVAKLYRAEDQFSHHLLDQISHHEGGKKKGMAPPPAPPD
ncbi:MAG TPA: Spy/CpxP family protein refolding chaperone, partial [Bacteroidia bacterium]